MTWPNDVTKADLRIEYYRGSGSGGQHRNKRDTACRITHVPTGKVGTAQEHKSQAQNRSAAFRRLAGVLIPMMRELLGPARPVPEHADVIRTYNAQRHTVKSHQTGKTAQLERVLDGHLEDIQ